MMRSSIQLDQREKERKVFDSFSSFCGMGDIQQISGEENSYPDGVLIQDGQKIAIEQTDYYYYKTGKVSSYKRFQSLLSNVAKQLSDKGYKGCVGIRMDDKAYSIPYKELSPSLIESIQNYIACPENHTTNSLITKIHYCPKINDVLIIKDYACDLQSFVFCKNLSLEEMISERVREKEEKLRNCKKDYSQHWLIISIPFEEYVNVDTREYNPVKTLFDKIFIQRDGREFEEIKTEKVQVKQS